MDYAKSFTFVFDDPRWITKIAIGTGLILVSSLLSVILIGVLGFFILGGYSIRLLQNVRRGDETPLPEWDDWGGDFMRGLKYAVVGIVWALPMIIFILPMIIGGAIADGNGSASLLGGLIMVGAMCFMFLYGLFVALAAPGFTIAFSGDEQITSGLQFTEIWHWTRANIGQVIVAVLVILLAQFVITMVGSIVGAVLCLVGMAITVPLATLAVSIFQHHVYGQLAHEFPFGGTGVLAPYSPAGLATTNLGDLNLPAVADETPQTDVSDSDSDSEQPSA
jgi:hypothetical protein